MVFEMISLVLTWTEVVNFSSCSPTTDITAEFGEACESMSLMVTAYYSILLALVCRLVVRMVSKFGNWLNVAKSFKDFSNRIGFE